MGAKLKKHLAWILSISLILGSGGFGLIGDITSWAEVGVKEQGIVASDSQAYEKTEIEGPEKGGDGEGRTDADETGAEAETSEGDKTDADEAGRDETGGDGTDKGEINRDDTSQDRADEVEADKDEEKDGGVEDDLVRSDKKATASDAEPILDDSLTSGVQSDVDTEEILYSEIVDKYKIDIYIQEGTFQQNPDIVIQKKETISGENINKLIRSSLQEKETIVSAVAFDITFKIDGEEVQPQRPVRVNIQFTDEPYTDGDVIAKVFHVEDDKTLEEVPCDLFMDDTVTYQADSFSVYGIVLVSSDAIAISTIDEFMNIGEDGNYILMNDLDFSGVDKYRKKKFSGILDGNGYSIINFNIKDWEVDTSYSDYSGKINNCYIGLFEELKGSVKNLNFKNCNIEFNGSGYGHFNFFRVGLAASTVRNGSLENITAENCNIDIHEVQYGYSIGGIAGYIDESSIANCRFDGDIEVDKCIRYVGGIIGYSFGPCSISRCINHANIKIHSYADTTAYGRGFGGICGSGGKIDQSANLGTIEVYGTVSDSEGCAVGGIAGTAGGITDCFNTGDLFFDGTFSCVWIGGISGDSRVKNSYNIGDIDGLDSSQIINQNNSHFNWIAKDYKQGDITQSYIPHKDGEKSYISKWHAVELSTTEMKDPSSFKGFDFDSVWKMGEEHYPYPIFQWMDMKDLPDVPDIPITPKPQNIKIGWAELIDEHVGYYDSNGELLKDGRYLLHYLDDSGMIFEGYWSFDSNGYVITGVHDGYYYYETKNGLFPYGLEVPEEDIRETLKRRSSRWVLGKYEFINTFDDDLHRWKSIFLFKPEDGIGLIARKMVYDLRACLFLSNDPPKSAQYLYMTDANINKKVLKEVIEAKFSERTGSILSNKGYKVTKNVLDFSSDVFSKKFNDHLKEMKKMYKEDPNGPEWSSDAFRTLLANMDEEQEEAYFSAISNHLIKTFNTLLVIDDEWQKVAMDYSERIEFLESLKSTVKEIPGAWGEDDYHHVLIDVIEDLENEYKNRFEITVADTVIKTVDEIDGWKQVITGSDHLEVIDWLKTLDFSGDLDTNIVNVVKELIRKGLSKIKVYGKVTKLLDIVQTIDGRPDAIDSVIETQALYGISCDFLTAAEKALIEDGAGQKELVDYLNIFELLRYLDIIRYQNMKKFYTSPFNEDGEKRLKIEFLEMEIKKLENTTPLNYYLDDFQPSEFSGYWNDEERRYYFFDQTFLSDGWRWIDGKKYYFDDQGHPLVGLQTFQKIQGENGVDEQYPNNGGSEIGHDYYFSTGSGDIAANRDHYGAMQTGEVEIGGSEYYFYPQTGRKARDVIVQVSPDKEKYYDANGIYDPHKKYEGVIQPDPGRKKYLINCPVDVYVYDSADRLVASIINDEVKNIIGNTISVEIDKNDQKIIDLPLDGDHRIKVIATDNGEMDYSVIEYPISSDEKIRKIDYRDVSLSRGDIYYGISQVLFDGSSSDKRIYLLLKDDEPESIAEIQEDINIYPINISIDGMGNSSNDQFAIRGNHIKLIACPEPGNRFVGWYDKDGICISREIEYKFRVLGSCDLTAKFETDQNTSLPEIPPSEDGSKPGVEQPSIPSGPASGTSSGGHKKSSKSGGSDDGTYLIKGTWKQNENGWWFQYPNGSYPYDEWRLLTYMGRTDWYYFDKSGYMVVGWLLWDGKWYYLNPVSDGTKGRMLTGWQLIDGKWYYFNEVSDGVKGALLLDTWIGGYYVNSEGVWEKGRTK